MSAYTKRGTCTHCGGDVEAHCAGERIIYWCDRCGGNDDASPPFVELKFFDGTAAEERPGEERK